MPRQQVQDEDQQTGDSKDQYDPMAGRLTPYLADGGVIPNYAFGKEPIDMSSIPKAEPDMTEADLPQPTVAPVPTPPARPMPGMGPEVTPDALQQMLGQYKSGMEKYGPEQQMATREALTKANAGVLPTLARAGGGFADALMQGVARAGPSNFQQNITAGQNKAMDDTMSTMEKAQGGKMAQLNAQMKMSMDDPSSPLSKVTRDAQRPTLLKLGWTDDQINKVSGNTAEDAAKSGLTFYESQKKAELASEIHGENIGMQKSQLEALEARRRAETIQGAAKGLEGRTKIEKVRDFFSPSPETKALQGQLSGGSTNQSHGIPDLGSTFNGETVKAVKKIK